MTPWLPRWFAVLFLVFAFVIGVGSWSASSTQAADAKDPKLKALRKERLATLREIAAQTTKAYENGVPSVSFAQVLEANQAVGNAELDLCDTDKERLVVLEKLLAAAKEAEKLAEQLEKQAKAPAGSALKAKAIRLEIEIAVVAATAASDEAEIARLVKQLGDGEFATREGASRRLKEIGEPALDAVTTAVTSSDPEVRRRAEAIVAVIENQLYGAERILTGHTGVVWSISISADGKRLLTGGVDKTLRQWDADTGKELRVFEGHTERIVGAALSPDGKRALSGSDDKTVRLWDATTGKELQKMTGHTEQVWSVAFGPEGQALSGGLDHTLRLWDLNTGKNAGVFTGHTDAVYPVAYSDKAKLAATGSHDQSIRLWNLKTGKEVQKLTGHSGKGDLGVCFSPDGKRLVSCNYTDNTLRLWDVETGKELKRIAAPNAHCVAFSPDGKRIVSGSYPDAVVRVWDAESGKELRKYEGHTAAVVGVAFFPDGKRIASVSEDGTARIWRAPR